MIPTTQIHHEGTKARREDIPERHFGMVIRMIIGIAVLGSVLAGITSCGKVASGPISPLVNPPVAFGFEADLQGWTLDEGGSIPNHGMVYSYSTERALNSYASFKAFLNFNDAGDKAIIRYLMPTTPTQQVIDFSGKMISCWVYWDSGLASEGSKLGAQIFVKDTPGNNWANGTFLALEKNSWNQLLFNTNAPSYDAGADMTQIAEFGLQIVADIGTFTPGDIYIDNFAY